MSLGRFNPSGGRFGMGCLTGTYFSRTTKDFTSKSCEKEIKESLQCGWLAEIEKVTVKNEP